MRVRDESVLKAREGKQGDEKIHMSKNLGVRYFYFPPNYDCLDNQIKAVREQRIAQLEGL
jgi:hypothetical protein